MKVKSLYEEFRKEYLDSDTLYCCYCTEIQTGYSCCQENHFVRFVDLYPEDQQAIIDNEYDNAFNQPNFKMVLDLKTNCYVKEML